MAQEQKKPKNKPLVLLVSILFLIVLFTALFFIGTGGNKKVPAAPETKAQYVPPKFKSQGKLTFLNADDSKKLILDMEIADNPDERQTGMMRREEMTEEQCMLFIFNDEQVRSFWMSNTKLPLDIIFVNRNQEIVSIEKNAYPYDESHYWSEKPARYVVEVIGGFCDKHDINPGDKITWVRYDKFSK